MGIPLLAALCFYGLLYVRESHPCVARYPKQRCKDKVNFRNDQTFSTKRPKKRKFYVIK